MLEIEAKRQSSLPVSELEFETRRFTAVSERLFQNDTIEKKNGEPETPGKLSQIWASFCLWLSTTFSSEATPSGATEKDDLKIDRAGPTTVLPRPRPIDNAEGNRLMEELRIFLKQLDEQINSKITGSVDEALLKQYQAQSSIYEEAVLQGRENFAVTQSQKKRYEKAYTEVRKEYDQISQDSKWWTKANTYALYATAAVTAAVVVYGFGTARAGYDFPRVYGTIMKVAGGLLGISTAITGVAKANIDYQSVITQGKVASLRHKNWMSDISLRETINFLGDQYNRHNQQFVNAKEAGDVMYQTIRAFYS